MALILLSRIFLSISFIFHLSSGFPARFSHVDAPCLSVFLPVGRHRGVHRKLLSTHVLRPSSFISPCDPRKLGLGRIRRLSHVRWSSGFSRRKVWAVSFEL